MPTSAIPHPQVVSQDQWRAGRTKLPAHAKEMPSMQLNPMFDPFVEAGYLRYSLRAIAHRRRNGTFRPFLEIRDYRYGTGELLYEHVVQNVFFDADAAIDCAMGKGRQVIDDLLEVMMIVLELKQTEEE